MTTRFLSRMALRIQHRAKAPLLTMLSISLASITLAQDDAKPIVVTKAKVLENPLNKITLTGTVTSPRRSQLSARTEGLIQTIHVDAGSKVKQGDLLMELDPAISALSLELITAEQEQAEVELADAQRLVDEITSLTKTGAFPESQANTLKADVRIAQAKMKQLDAREKLQQERITRHQLIAPFDGVIVDKLAETGEWVTTGTPVVELIEMQNLRFDVQVPQEFLGKLRNAKQATVKLDALPEQTFDAKLAVAVPVKNPISRTFLIRLALENADANHLAAPGMSGTATIVSQQQADSIIQVPRDAVVRFPDGSAKVWIVTKDGNSSTVNSQRVTTAGGLNAMANITSGLSGDETIVLKGNEGLSENQAVTILPNQARSSH